MVEPIHRGQEITISYVRTFCSKRFRQDLLFDRFGFNCACAACALTGARAEHDDKNRMEIDRLAQQFSAVSV